MPKHELPIALNNMDKEKALAIGYQAMKSLGWLVQFAGEDKLLGSTPKSWKTLGIKIMLTVESDTLTVTSEMVNGESFDMGGKNKKNTAAFSKAFEAAKNIDEAAIENNKAAINTLRAATIKTLEEENEKAAEVDKALHLSGSNLYATYTIMGLNVLVFVLMVINGAGLVEPNGLVHIKWGSNYTPLTLSGDWWRLISNTFIHFGIIHLLMNMYCLYMAGVYLEPMLGKGKYIAAYLCTGVLASLTSLWWHTDGINSAGASGAIFGMYGLFLALLTTSLIPKAVRQSLLSSIGIFVVYNLVYGMKGGVDNSAHVGGLLSGFVIGYIYAFGIKKGKEEQKLNWIIPVVIIVTIAITVGYLQQHKVSAEERTEALNGVIASAYKDNDKYIAGLNEIYKIEDKAIAPLNDSTLTDEQRKEKIDSTSLPLWTQAEEKLNQMQSYDISTNTHLKTTKLLEYIALRKKEDDIIIKIIETKERESLIPELKEARENMNKIVKEIKSL